MNEKKMITNPKKELLTEKDIILDRSRVSVDNFKSNNMKMFADSNENRTAAAEAKNNSTNIINRFKKICLLKKNNFKSEIKLLKRRITG